MKKYRWAFCGVGFVLTIVALILLFTTDGVQFNVNASTFSYTLLYSGPVCLFGGGGKLTLILNGDKFTSTVSDSKPFFVGIALVISFFFLVLASAYEFAAEVFKKKEQRSYIASLIPSLFVALFIILTPKALSDAFDNSNYEHSLGNGWLLAMILVLAGAVINTITCVISNKAKVKADEDSVKKFEEVKQPEIIENTGPIDDSLELTPSDADTVDDVELYNNLREQYRDGKITKEEFIKALDDQIH